MIYWRYCVLLMLVFIFCTLGSDSVYAGNLTGSWNGTVTGGGTGAHFNSTAGNITVTGVVTTTGNARWGPTDPGVPGSVGFSNGSFNTVNFWSNSSAAGHRSLQSTYWWDINPEAVGTDIDRSGDDKGTGYITFYFSKPVLNPVLHIDRIGGDGHITSTYIITNSALFTLVNPNLSLTKLSGNGQFRVTSTTIERTPDQVYSSITQNATWSSNSAAAGSVRINGVVSSVTFKWTGVGIESEGHDGLELIWELTDDSTPPTINATVTPNLTKTGRIVTIKATSSSDTKTLTATILRKIYNLVKGSGNTWTLKYTVPKVSNGTYNILLTATDLVGNKGKSTLKFTVDNTPPIIKASVTPKLTKTGNVITIKATASSDTKTLTATILRKTYNMVKGTGGVWTLMYTIPKVSSGTYNILLIATDRVGNKGKSTLKFTVDNTLPAIAGAFFPGLTKSGNVVILKAAASSDTRSVIATIFGKTYKMVKGTNGLWTLKYTVPSVSNGNYNAILTANDRVGNNRSLKVSLTVYNPALGLSTNNPPYNPHANTLSKNNCGPVVLSKLLNGLGIKANASSIALLAGTNKQGTSFYGLVQAAKRFGVNLTGLKLKSNQLQAGDIVLLNVAGVNHYAMVLQRIGNYIILQDPVLGTIALNMNTFNKFYTGYALVLNPNGRGVPLSVNEMKNLKGKVTIFESWTNKFKNWISFNTYGSAYNDYYNRNVHDVNSYLLYTTSANAGQLQLAANPQTLMLLYLERALIEPHSDLGDMINPPAFIKLYGFNYKHLDSNSKFWMEAASGIDPNGNMSYFNYLLNLLIILPGEFLGSSLLRVLSKAGTLGKILSGLGISIVERVLGKRAVQMLSLAYKNGSATLRRYLIDPILKKFPKFKIPSIKEVWQGAVKIAKLITLDPVEWYKTLKNTPIGKLVFGNKQQNLQALLRKMGLRGKVKPSELPYYINLIKSVTEGPLGIVKFGLGIFTKATQNALTRWLNSSNFKKKYFQTVTTITNSPLYKGVHEKTKTWIKGLLEITGVYGASRTLYNEYQQMKKYGLTGYVKYKFNNLKKSFTDNKYVKGLYKEYKKYKEYGLTGYVKYKIKHNKYTAGLYKEYKKYKKYGLTGYVKYKFNNFKKAVANNKYVKAAVKYTKAAANYVNNTWNGATRWAGGFLGEFFHRR